ncbi:putative protein phosphatase 2C 50 [Cornus florida]|uniref:putative protein phosphatase 2C 50 n=1 Tax=Cornus florida TaxID=4283 RepID=UPI0028A0BE0D|nr:putative protein phosphatase 2C 50 [Cornus florida]
MEAHLFHRMNQDMRILKEALLRTIRDIDLAFSEATVTKNLRSASTATIVAMVHGHILVASVGHPKALLCSEKVHSHEDMEGILGSYLSLKELTRVPPPTKEDERARLLARVLPADGLVFSFGDRPLVDGFNNTTPAIGFTLKSNGFIEEHEVADWQPLTADDIYLVVATGVFQRLTPQMVCVMFYLFPK